MGIYATLFVTTNLLLLYATIIVSLHSRHDSPYSFFISVQQILRHTLADVRTYRLRFKNSCCRLSLRQRTKDEQTFRNRFDFLHR